MSSLIWLLVIGGIYFFPSIVAIINKKKNASAIFILNFFLGWTFIGWVIALVWVTMKDK